MNTEILEAACEEFLEDTEDPTSEIYYYNAKDRFLVKDSRGKFMPYNRQYVSKKIGSLGFNREDVSDLVYQIQTEKVIDGYFEVAGLPMGIQEISDQRILIHREQKRICPVKGEWKTFKEFLFNMLGKDQAQWFLGWLSIWLKSYYNYSWSPGQILVLMGEPAAGKSLLQRFLTKIFGDKVGDPLAWMTGKSEFNYELASCSHLAIEDRFSDSSKKARDAIREYAKDISVNETHRFRGMHKEAVMLAPLWRATISCNPSDESMAVIPPIEEATRNKVSLLWCKRHDMPMPTNTFEEKKEFMNKLMQEAPCLIYHLINEFRCPTKFDCPEARMGVKGYQDKSALMCAENASYYGQKMQIIQDILLKYQNRFIEDGENDKNFYEKGFWKGKPQDIFNLFSTFNYNREFTNAISVGKVLTNRANLKTGEVTRNGDRTYTIKIKEE